MTSADWSILPFLPLKCVLAHLGLKDALSATSTCRNWRQAIYTYEGRRSKETLSLTAQNMERNEFLTGMFMKYTRSLVIYLDCVGPRLDHFIQHMFPKFYDATLNELIFITPEYLVNKDKKLSTLRFYEEELIRSQEEHIYKLGFFGCEPISMTGAHYHCEFQRDPLQAFMGDDYLRFRTDAKGIYLFHLNYLAIDYESSIFENISWFPNLVKITVNIVNKKSLRWKPIKWNEFPDEGVELLSVEVNIIEMPLEHFPNIIDNVLRQGAPLTALRVIYCKSIYQPLLKHVTRMYHTTLRELQWVDAPHDIKDLYRKPDDPLTSTGEMVTYQHDASVNPLILLCWRCTKLEQLVIHGYWIGKYDLLGMVRLRHTTLLRLDVSAIYDENMRRNNSFDDPVVLTDRDLPQDEEFIKDVNKHLNFTWAPVKRWGGNLHPGLASGNTPQQRSDYVYKLWLAQFGFP